MNETESLHYKIETMQSEDLDLRRQIDLLKRQLAISTEALGIIKYYRSRLGDDVQSEIAQKALNKIQELK